MAHALIAFAHHQALPSAQRGIRQPDRSRRREHTLGASAKHIRSVLYPAKAAQKIFFQCRTCTDDTARVNYVPLLAHPQQLHLGNLAGCVHALEECCQQRDLGRGCGGELGWIRYNITYRSIMRIKRANKRICDSIMAILHPFGDGGKPRRIGQSTALCRIAAPTQL